MYSVDIYGEKFVGFIIEPKIYVIETLDDISKFENEDIEFDFGIFKYFLQNITEHSIAESGLKMIECNYWKESVIQGFY